MQILVKETFHRLVTELEELAQKHMCDESVPNTSEGWEEEPQSAAPAVACTVLVVVGRICQALPSICSHLQICASASSMSTSLIRVSMKNHDNKSDKYIFSKKLFFYMSSLIDILFQL